MYIVMNIKSKGIKENTSIYDIKCVMSLHVDRDASVLILMLSVNISSLIK